jgi:hypothetical protein
MRQTTIQHFGAGVLLASQRGDENIGALNDFHAA